MNTETSHRGADKAPQIAGTRRDDDRVIVVWQDGSESSYPSIWLRHSLFFPIFRDAESGSEVPTLPDDPDEVRPKHVAISTGGEITIEWHPDGQVSHFNSEWLWAHRMDRAARLARRRPLKYWDKAIGNATPSSRYPDFVSTEAIKLEGFRALLDYGFLILRDVPAVPGAIEEVAAQFGVISVSHMDRIFDVRLDPTMNNGANSTRFLGPHVDESCRYVSSGISMLHCIKAHPQGGQSLLVDGFSVCRKLKARDRQAYDVLARVPLYYDVNSYGLEMQAFGKVISEDPDGTLMGVRFNDRSLSPLDAPEELIKPTYRALREFVRELTAPDNQIRFTLTPGDLLVYDNQRVLHGRTWFDASLAERHLQNCTMDRDIVHGKFRALAKKLGQPDWNQVLPCGVTI